MSDQADCICGSGFGMNLSCPVHSIHAPRPAAVSAPAGEATCVKCGHVHGALTDFCWHLYENGNRCQCSYTVVARSPASASGAPDEEVTSGAAEAIAAEIDRLARDVPVGESFNGGGMHGAAVYDCMRYAAGLVRQIGRRSPDVSAEAAENDALRTRLAASERAGEAMREALLGDDPEMPPALRPLDTIAAAVELARAFVYGDRSEFDEDPMATSDTVDDAVTAIANLRAALTPTSPAPSPEERADG